MKYTDDQLLINCFHMLIHKENTIQMYVTGNPYYIFKDGFEERIDEDTLSPIMYDLAKRCGYVLVDGMWKEK